MLACVLPAYAGYFDDHPLTAGDVALYLQVMDKAAARAATQRAGQKTCPAMPDTKNRAPTQADINQMTAAANCMAGAASVLTADDAVAKEMGVTAKYEPIRDAIEAQVQYDPSSKDGVGNGSMTAGGCGDSDCYRGPVTAAQKANWARQDGIAKQNRAFLLPYRAKIQHDLFLVRAVAEKLAQQRQHLFDGVDHRLGLVVLDAMAGMGHHAVAAARRQRRQPVMALTPGLADCRILRRCHAGIGG